VEDRVEETFHTVASYIALVVEMAAVAVVACGAGSALVSLTTLASTKGWQPGRRKAIWRDFGIWLVLGLEFELAADIVRSVITPTWLEIGQLGAIAVIRTFLNYFLEKDLEEGASKEPTSGALATASGSRE
jgi:uncharacterized membrane protein